MRNKKDVIPILQADLVKYCEQIGITEVPVLVFSPNDFDSVCSHERKQRRLTKKYLGMCCRPHKTILVNLDKNGKIWRDHIWNRKRRVYKEVTWGLREARYVLVHELVHYRWKSFAEGRQQHERTREILAGRRFEPDHETTTTTTTTTQEKAPSPIIEINPRLGPWIESYLSVYR